MKITCTNSNGAAIIVLEGNLLIDRVAEARPGIMTAIAESNDIQLDVAGIRACDTAGIQLLLSVRGSALAKGASMQLTARSPSFIAAGERIAVPCSAFDVAGATALADSAGDVP